MPPKNGVTMHTRSKNQGLDPNLTLVTHQGLGGSQAHYNLVEAGQGSHPQAMPNSHREVATGEDTRRVTP